MFDAAPGGTVLMCLMLLPVITATATATATATDTATAEATMSPNLQKPAQGWIQRGLARMRVGFDGSRGR